MPLSRAFDELFAKYGDPIPVTFLRALASKESDLNPGASMGAHGAKGLLQVTEVVLRDYNEANHTSYVANDLFDPETNVKIASFTQHRILKSYAQVSSLKEPEWYSRRWVELFTFGWNAGYSLAAGVAKVASQMDAKGLPKDEITIDTVSAEATRLRGLGQLIAIHLTNQDKVKWCKGVVTAYFREAGVKDPSVPPHPGDKPGPFLAGLGVTLLLALLRKWWKA